MSIINIALRNVSKIIGSNSMGTALETVLDSFERSRLTEEALYWDYYNGRFYTGAGESGNLPYINLIKGKVRKSISWLVGQPPEFRFREDIHTLMEELSSDIIQNSGGAQFFYDAVEMGSVSGNVILHPHYDQSLNMGQGGIAIKVLETDKVFLEYRNENNKKKLSRVLIIYEELDEAGQLIINVEIWDEENVEIYSKNESVLPRGFGPGMLVPVQFRPIDLDLETNQTYTANKFKHPYGELPFIHIMNLPSSNSIFGQSDVQDDWILNEELNEQLLSYKDNTDYHGNPLTLMYGISAKNLEKGAGKVWGNLPPDGRVENLEVTQTFEMITTYMNMLTRYSGLGSIPFYMHSLDQSITGDTSQAGMRLAFLPMIEYTELKKISYGKGFKEAMEMSLRFLNGVFKLSLENLDAPDKDVEAKLQSFVEKLPPVKGEGDAEPVSPIAKILALRVHPFFECSVEFKDHLPRNRTLELADVTLEMQNNLESLKGALARLGVTDIESKMEEIASGRLFIAQLTRQDTIVGDPNVKLPDDTGKPNPDNASGDSSEGSDSEDNPAIIEENTNQSAERTIAQRQMKGKGDL